MEVALDQSTLTSTSDQVGYVVLNSGETITGLGLATVQARSQILFNTLESTDTTALASGSTELYKQEILLGNDQSIVFARMADGEIADATSLDDYELFTIATEGADQATLSTTSGLELTLTEITSRDQDLDALIGLVHGAPDHTKFCHWAIIFNEPGVRCAARGAELRRLSGHLSHGGAQDRTQGARRCQKGLAGYAHF